MAIRPPALAPPLRAVPVQTEQPLGVVKIYAQMGARIGVFLPFGDTPLKRRDHQGKRVGVGAFAGDAERVLVDVDEQAGRGTRPL